ncbi:hypothetical protein NN3_63950 [Nocardia neocaledoniensis NBRC 108232]|uniref:Uncharacterized protein n=1 Tax=Nocardia neocaledoniensis TaxID=236511 RepID=A0A317N884_9NOCA|nr:hypothetical protein DFR69_11515 [Nocardia neocaledoniensis]GEM35388.1 hypothetical protein NN3_63950 [Nocardia neocaledoniensis NBRC 108232]
MSGGYRANTPGVAMLYLTGPSGSVYPELDRTKASPGRIGLATLDRGYRQENV